MKAPKVPNNKDKKELIKKIFLHKLFKSWKLTKKILTNKVITTILGNNVKKDVVLVGDPS